ncbi:hypothetical protein I3900191A7_16430 [Clostridium baratii]|uniref:BppU family phage baseplate upper protein n=1 Tax=Clostridium baratii TaxID=1561 RepID=UPI0036F3A892
MKNIKKGIDLNIDVVNYAPITTLKQEDNATLELNLYKDGEEFNITGQTVKLGAYRPNKTIVEQLDGFTIDNNALTIDLKNNILAVHGIVEVDLTLTDPEGEMTTASFYLKVNKKVLGSDNIAASDEIDSLKQIKIDLTALNENIKREENTRVANEKIRVSEEKTRKTNETERVNFYEDVAKPLVEDLSKYDKKIEDIYHTIRENDYLPFEGENTTVEHSLTGMTKDMIIEGRTLQNLFDYSKLKSEYEYSDGIITNVTGEDYAIWTDVNSVCNLIKSDTIYTILIKELTENTRVQFSFNQSDLNTIDFSYVGEQKILKVTSLSDSTGFYFKAYCSADVKKEVKVQCMLLEGDWTNKQIPPYFEGIKSVGELEENKISISSYGKNIYDKDKFKLVKNKALATDNGNTYDVTSGMWYAVLDFIPIPSFKNGMYLLPNSERSSICFYDINKNFVGYYSNGNKTTIPTNAKYFRFDTNKDDIQTMQIELTDVTTPKTYEQYKEDKKEILLPYTDGLKGLPTGEKDIIISKEDGVYIKQNIEKIILNGNEDYTIYKYDSSKETIMFFTRINRMKSYSKIINNKFVQYFRGLGDGDFEGCFTDADFNFRIKKEKLETPDVEGLKKRLQTNPITVYYELTTPIEHKVTELNSINLETFKDITHVFSENEIQPKLTFKAPVNVPETISSLRIRNESLEQENKELKEEVSVKTLKLHGQDVELTNSDLDLDFRIFELEMSIGLPINLNMKGMRSMARSPFEMMKILILNNNYDKEDIEYKASRYLKGGRMTQAEYDEIISLMDANELVK